MADAPGLDPGGSPVQVKVLSQRRKLQSACGDFYNVNLYYNPNLFPIGDTFGLLVFFDRYEATHFRNGKKILPTSKPRGTRKKKLK